MEPPALPPEKKNGSQQVRGGGGRSKRTIYSPEVGLEICDPTLQDLKAERKVSTKKTVGKSSPKPPEFIDLEVSFVVNVIKYIEG